MAVVWRAMVVIVEAVALFNDRIKEDEDDGTELSSVNLIRRKKKR